MLNEAQNVLIKVLFLKNVWVNDSWLYHSWSKYYCTYSICKLTIYLKPLLLQYNQKYEVVREFDDFTFENQSIDQVGSYKYLGVILSNSGLRFSQRFDYVKEKASRAIISANIYIRQAVKDHLPINLYLKVFDTQIRPILEYASEIWCPGTPIEDLERVHLKFLKSILGAYSAVRLE